MSAILEMAFFCPDSLRGGGQLADHELKGSKQAALKCL